MRRLLPAFCLLTVTFGWAQTVSKIDINASINASGSNPSNFTNVSGVIFFTATDPERGTELWKTDGTANGTVVVKDINQGSGSSSPSYLTAIGSTVYFAANDGINGSELWKSDGTANGTVLVKDIYSGTSSSSPSYIIAVGSTLYFSADNGTNGRELWKSDGSTANTSLLADIYAGSTGSSPAYLTNANGKIYFRATDATHGTELYYTTGSTATFVEDLYAGASNNSSPFNFIALNAASSNIVFFSAYDATYGQELWRSDGTAAGTYVINIYYQITGFTTCGLSLCPVYDNSGSSSPDYFATTGTNVFFAATSSTTGREVYRHDGTTLTLVQDFVASGDLNPQYLTNANGNIYFSGSSGGDRELYKATTSAVTLASNINASSSSSPSDFEAAGSTVFFSATHATNGTEFYSFNGTTLTWLADINSGASSSSPTNKAYLGGVVYLSAATDTYGRELWLYNGSSTSQLKDINGGTEDSNPASILNTGTTLYFQATSNAAGYELWKSDGTQGGTSQVVDLLSGTSSSYATPFAFTNSLVHFSGNGGTQGYEFYVSTGATGNSTLREINTVDVNGSNPQTSSSIYYVTLGSDVYFQAYHPTYGYELWKSTNGAAATLVTDLYSGTGSSNPAYLTVFGSFVYFAATDDVDGNELYRTSGSGATLIQDLNISGSSYPSHLCVVGANLYWSADNGADGYELFKTTGTGATMVKTGGINPGSGSSFAQLMTNVNGTLFFRATDGTNGTELWKSDGTSANTVMVKDINTSGNSAPNDFTAVGSVLYFTATEATYGTELYKSDGTTPGTVLVKDIFSGTSSSSPSRLKNINSTLYFRASDGSGLYLMKTNGTSAGTIVATSSGETYQGVDEINYLNGNVYWVGTTNAWGKELLYIKAEPTAQPTALVINGATQSTLNLSWAAASPAPAGYIVIRNAGTSPTGLPVDGVAPAVNSTLASGTGAVAYVGTGTSFTDTGLSSTTTYYYTVYSYNNGGGSVNVYRPASPLTGNNFTLAANPTAQASAVFTSNVLQNSITVNWTSGNGSERIVLAKQSASAITDVPVDGSSYTASTTFGSGSLIGTSRVVYRGSGSSVNVTGLTPALQYQFAIFEVNGTTTQSNYLTPGVTGSATTQALDGNQPTNLVFSAVTTTSFTLNWTAATAPGTTGYIITRRVNSDPVDAPQNMTSYSVGNTINGTSTVVYNADVPGTVTFNQTGLTAGTVYYYRVYAKTAATTYVTANPLTGIQASLQTEPTGAPGAITLTPTSSSLSGTFAAGTGATSYVVLGKQGSAVSPDVPIDGTTYAVGNTIGSSTVVYVGLIGGLPFTVNGLSSNTIYHVAAFSAAGSGPTINYLTSSSSVANRTTLFDDPIDQPSNIQFSNITTTSFDVNFNDAPTLPDGYLVARRTGSPVASAPADGTAYALGNSLGSGATVVYVGNGTSFSESGLTPGNTYYYAAVAYTGSGAATNYLIAGAPTASQTTLSSEPANQPTALSFSGRTQTQLSFSFSAASGSPAGYLVLRSSDSAPTSAPVDGVEYVAGGLIGTAVVVQVGSALTVNDNDLGNDLVDGTQYFYKIFSFNGTTGNYNYNTTTPLQGNAFTIADEPIDHPTAIVFSNPTTTSMTIGFTEPTDLPEGYLVLRKTGSAPTGIPADGTTYSLGGTIGDGTVAFIGSAIPFTVTGLAASNTYYYAVYPFNGTGTSSNFLTVATTGTPAVPVLTGNRTTLQTEPANQPTSITFTNKTTTSYSVGFTASDAARYLILRKPGTSTPTEIPVDGTVYPDGGTFGSSTTFSVNVAGIPLNESGLTLGTDYSYTVYAFNGITGANNYLTTSPLTGMVATLAPAPAAQPTGLSFSVVQTENMTVSWTAPASAVSGYLVLRKVGGAPTGIPVGGTAYTLNSTIGDGTVAYVGTATNFIDFPLDGATDYYYQVFALNVANGNGATVNYLTTSPPTGHQLTFDWEPVNQPTALTFTSITNTSWTVGFTPDPDDFATGHIAIRKNGSDPTGAPVDGTTYVVGNALGDGIIAYIGSASSFPETMSLAPYHYAIFAYIGSGPSINYKSTSPLKGTITVDATPPTFTNETALTVASGSPLTVRYTLDDQQTGISGLVTLEFRAINSATAAFTTRTMILNAGKYEAALTAVEIGEQGVFYRVKGTNGHGVQGTSSLSTTLVSVSALALPALAGGTEQSSYKIIAIPLVLANKAGNQVFAALGDSKNGENWRMFRYSAGATTEITNLANLTVEPGLGYWLLTRNGVTISPGAGNAVSVTDTAPFSITLTPGWNQIGNPYLFNILWSDVNNINGTNLNLRIFNGGFGPGTTLQTFQGGFVQAGGALTLNIPTAKNPAAGREAKVEPKVNPIDSEDWEVIINVSNGELKNPFGGVGMNKDAKAEYDYFDDFTLPRFMNFVELNHNKKAYGMTYTKDILPLADNYTWEISVDANVAGLTELSWDNSYFGVNDKQLILWDEDAQMGIDMREARSYSFAQTGRKMFKVLYGSREYIDSKVELNGLRIHSISPNPSHSDVRVAFSLPGSQSSFVNVRVVNNLGQQVATIYEGSLQAGYHEVAWSGSDVRGERPAAGVYLVEVINGEERTSKRLLLK